MYERQSHNQNEAAVLAERPEQEIDLMEPASYYGWQTKYSAWDHFLRSLYKKQFINPCLAFKKFFKYQNIPVGRDVLYDLLEMGEYDMLAVQKLLKRMVEAAHFDRGDRFHNLEVCAEHIVL